MSVYENDKKLNFCVEITFVSRAMSPESNGSANCESLCIVVSCIYSQ